MMLFSHIRHHACVSACMLAAISLAACNREQTMCASLAGQVLADGTAHVANAKITDVANICQVEITLPDSTLRTEVRLPMTGWNTRLLFLGGGGFDGLVPTAELPQFSDSAADGRYATAATNGGYDYPGLDLEYFNATFAYDPRKLDDFTHASEHRALPAVLALIETFYGKPPERRYFEGCSMGGHDALILAQRHWQDFDGIIARAPAGNIIGLMLQFHRIASIVREPGAVLSGRQLERLQSAVLEHCDLDDGLRDGLVSRPLQCQFDPASLRCAANAPAEDCFSEVQMRLLETVTTPLKVNARWQHPGYPFSGAESDPKGWPEYVLPRAGFGHASLQQYFSDGFLRAFVVGEHSFDTTKWRAEDWTESLEHITALFQANNSDLSAFHARGGKLILWTGTADTSVSLRDTVEYYQQVQATLGIERTREMVELFLAPGVGHCSGGPGPDRIDLLQALSDWLDTGIPPSRQGLVHQKRDQTGNVILERPACAWPSWPQHHGQGAPGKADNFVCANESSVSGRDASH